MCALAHTYTKGWKADCTREAQHLCAIWPDTQSELAGTVTFESTALPPHADFS